MNAPKIWKLVPALVMCCVAGLASAKLPAPPPEDPAKAEATKKKAAEAAKASADQQAKAEDRAVENYKKQQKGAAASTKVSTKQK